MPHSLLMLQLCFGCRGSKDWKKNLRQAGVTFLLFFFLIYSNHRFGTVDLTLVPQKL